MNEVQQPVESIETVPAKKARKPRSDKGKSRGKYNKTKKEVIN